MVGPSPSTVLWVVAAILLWPGDAYAWGPATHLDLGLQVLREIAVLTPVVRGVLRRFPDNYLYGCIAADIVVGKNLAHYVHHCHNWQVGFKVLGQAKDDRQRSLCYGFLSHLAADVVAHNYFVPWKTVESFRSKLTKHTYWELRFDQVAHDSEGVWQTLRRIGRQSFPEDDAFLEQHLVSSSRLFPFRMSRGVFNSILLIGRLRRWRQTMAVFADRSPWPLPPSEVTDLNRLSLDAVLAFLIDLGGATSVAADPTGTRNLRVAKDLRRELRLLWRSGQLDIRRWPEVAPLLRQSFRDAIFRKLEIPEIAGLLAPRASSSAGG